LLYRSEPCVNDERGKKIEASTSTVFVIEVTVIELLARQ
jgi:hypothetical protein